MQSIRLRCPAVASSSLRRSAVLGMRAALPVAPRAPRSTRLPIVMQAAAADAGSAEPQEDFWEGLATKLVGKNLAPVFVTGGFIALWYALNVAFNLQNKVIFNYFPFPWTVSTVHVIVGAIYCWATYIAGAKKASFGRPINKEEFTTIFGPAAMHALGHIAANLSFAAVAISLTHTVKTLEPAFNVVLAQLILGTATPVPVMLALVPIMLGVSLASAAELSFNWLGFITAMLSNLTFGFRAVWSKRAMTTIKNLDSTAIYAYTTLISVMICTPLALIFEGPQLVAGAQAAIAKVGASTFWGSLVSVGLLYHLYNQFAFNTLARVNPVSHGVCNVVKRIVIIGSSVMFFGNKLTVQTQVGTIIALAGTALYTYLSDQEKKKHGHKH